MGFEAGGLGLKLGVGFEAGACVGSSQAMLTSSLKWFYREPLLCVVRCVGKTTKHRMGIMH